jgi:hypothetical protein
MLLDASFRNFRPKQYCTDARFYASHCPIFPAFPTRERTFICPISHAAFSTPGAPKQAPHREGPNVLLVTSLLLLNTPHTIHSITSTTLSLDEAASKMPGTHGSGEQLAEQDNGPDEQDVLLGRGKKYAYHPGNIYFTGTNLDFAQTVFSSVLALSHYCSFLGNQTLSATTWPTTLPPHWRLSKRDSFYKRSSNQYTSSTDAFSSETEPEFGCPFPRKKPRSKQQWLCNTALESSRLPLPGDHHHNLGRACCSHATALPLHELSTTTRYLCCASTITGNQCFAASACATTNRAGCSATDSDSYS